MTRVCEKGLIRSLALSLALRLTVLLAGFAGLPSLADFVGSAEAAALPQPIKVEAGLVQGSATDADGVQSFKGIPYAAPPRGELRWRPPAPAHPWTGILHADHFAADCPTSMPLPESTAGSQSEDCLYLNVWTPANKPSAKLPVMVWIYGSGFLGASASYRRYDGEALARQGVVLVSFDYRNGILGFMTHPLLSAESANRTSGNYGLLDVLAALEWVKRNVAAFGGDPSKITIFGQSSGSETVNLMTASPLAHGLFQRAIGESGGAFGQRETSTLAEVEPRGVAFGEKLGVKTLAELRAKTTDELFAAKPPRFEPVIDGWVLPADVRMIYLAGRQNDVPMLVGSNADESQRSSTLTASQFVGQARDHYGARAVEFLRSFPAATDEEARGSAKTIGTYLGDYNSTTWARLQARSGKARVYQYRFMHTPPPSADDAEPKREGAYHGAEIPYAFHNLHLEPRSWSEIDRRLEAQLSSYWVNFARSGDPNGRDLPHWPSVQEDPGEVLQLGDVVHLIDRPNTTQIDFFERLFYAPGGLYPAATQDAVACEALRHFDSRGVEIVAAARQTAGPFKPSAPPGSAAASIDLPSHCLVSGIIERRTGADGRTYGIHFEMRLPDHWNGRFLFQGGGGTNGVVRPAIGQVKGPAALLSGFAVVTQDAGHEGADSSFGADQQARVDMIYRSYERVTGIAKSLIGAYYGKPPAYSYFMGCSEGGREALLASQRMPLEYDGVVAGDPGFLLGVRFQAEVDRLALAPLAPLKSDGKRDYSHTFSATDLHLVADTITAECDAGDGASDGIIEHWSGCRPKLTRLLCKREKTDSCLSAAQMTVLDRIYAGTPSLTPGYPYDTGVSQPAWQDKLAGGGRLGGGGVSSVQGLFSTPYDPSFDDEKLDMGRDSARFAEVGSLNRADGVMYSTFKKRGARLLIYTGLSDFAFSAKDLIAYYQRLAAANGGLDATQAFARLFLVPGMTHCRGGQALDDFDPLSAVVAWVEGHQAPQQLLATGQAFPGRTRPLCPYPAESIYRGTGSFDTAANFACQIPAASRR